MRRVVGLVGLAFILAPMPVNAQLWSGILSSSRAIDWSGAGVLGGIPERTTICATLSPGATASQINSAIANCPANQVVFLNAGTYNLGSSGISFLNKSNVTLRGAGADQTKLVFSGSVHQWTDCTGGTGTGLICVRNAAPDNWTGGPHNAASWTGGYAKGTSVITLSSTTNLAVGRVIILDQLDDGSDTGGIYVCTSRSCTAQGSSGASRAGRGQVEMKTVTAINGNQVTISPPLYMPNWRADRSPGAWWANSTVSGVGIEDLSVENNGNATSSFFFNNALNCWVKGVRSAPAPARNHVWMYVSARITIRDSYFYGTRNAAAQSYGIEAFPTSDSLIENNILQHVAAPIMLNGSSPGTVAGYNFGIDNYYTPSSSWMQPLITDHDANVMELMEGNDGQSMQSDNVHGTHHFITLFRNLFYGDPAKSGNTTIAHFWAFSRFFNVIGNVFGRAGYYNIYETNLESRQTGIYSFGEPDSGGLLADPNVRPTLMRWGNYDSVTGGVRFLTTEVPSGLSQFANPVPPSQTLPPSFYLSTKPAWFGAIAWPPIGPEVRNGTVSGFGGFANKIPARVCYENTAKTNGLLDFSAAGCYGSSQQPAVPPAPSNLVVQ